MSRIRRLSRAEAAREARDIALHFISTCDTKGWTAKVKEAKPSVLRSERDGKVPIHWVVGVVWEKDGGALEGPGIILVDIEAPQARWLETM